MYVCSLTVKCIRTYPVSRCVCEASTLPFRMDVAALQNGSDAKVRRVCVYASTLQSRNRGKVRPSMGWLCVVDARCMYWCSPGCHLYTPSVVIIFKVHVGYWMRWR